MGRKQLALSLLLPALAAAASCRGREAQPSPTLAELASEAGVPFPAQARLIGSTREHGMDDLLRFKVELPTGDLPAFLATCPVPAAAFEPGAGGLLGPDQGFWDPGRALHLRSGQKLLSGARVLNLGIDDGRADVVAIYVVNHGT